MSAIKHVIQRSYLFGVALAVLLPLTLTVFYTLFAENFGTADGSILMKIAVPIYHIGFFNSSLFALIITIQQYLSVKVVLKLENGADHRLNVTSLVFGVIAVLCLSIMTAIRFGVKYQENNFILLTMTMFSIIAFQLLQAVLTYRTKPGSSMAKGRLAITILSIIAAFAYLVSLGMYSYTEYKFVLTWKEAMRKESLQTATSITQMITMLFMFIYYLTFIQEMKAARIHLTFELVKPIAPEVQKTK